MKKNKLHFIMSLTFVSAIVMYACSSDNIEGIYKDSIHLSKRTIEFNANAASDTITTKGEGWMFETISDNGIGYYYQSSPDKVTSFTSDWIKVTKVNPKTIAFEVTANNTKKERYLNISIFHNGYNDSIKVIQK